MAKPICRVLPYALLVVCMPSFGEIRFNGFATFATGLTGGSDESLYGYDDSLSFKENSIFGLQVSSDLGDGLDATVQIKAEGSDDWDTVFEWAYIGYELNENVKFIMGRQRQAFYLYSQIVDVGYAYHWITPPRGVYSLPFDSTDGVSVLISNSFGAVESSFQLLVGRTQTEISFGGQASELDAKNGITVNWTLNYDWFSFRIGHTESKLDLAIADIDDLAAAWTTAAAGYRLAGFNDIAGRMESVTGGIQIQEDDASFSGVGITIDYEKFLFVAEATRLDLSDSFIGTNDSAFASFGYRINDTVMVHFTHGIDEDKGASGILGGIPLDLTGGTVPQLDEPLNQLILGTQAVLSSGNEESDYNTFGVRWDFHSAAALKIEYTQFSNDLNRTRDADLLQFAVSTVF